MDYFPTNWDCYTAKACAAMAENRVKDAEMLWLASVRIAEHFGEYDPRLPISLLNLAEVYELQGRMQAAQQIRERANRLQHHSTTINPNFVTSQHEFPVV